MPFLLILLSSLVVLSFDMPSVSYTDILANEPILYSNHPEDYKLFTPERLLPLHEEITKSLTSKVRFHVVPYLKLDKVKKQYYIEAELLRIYYQENTISLNTIRKHTGSIIATILKNFSELTEDNTITVFVRLPEGKKISDINPEMPDPCKSKNTISVDAIPKKYQPDKPDSLFAFICDGAKDLDDNLVDTRLPLDPDLWRLTPDKK
jgi:hypothetical protein